MLYETEVLFRGKQKPIKELKQNSKKKIKITCPSCGKVFFRFASVLFKTGNFLCQSCTLTLNNEKILNIGDKYHKLTVLGKHSTGKSLVECDCGNISVVSNWNLISGKTKSCGCIISEKLKSFRKNNPEFQKGRNHPNWKGGISKDRQRVMSTNEYKEWRKMVFKRDNYKCARCNQNSNNLEAHHILPYANNKALRLSVDNGITLCKECHKKFHTIYGRTNISSSELNDFLKPRI